MWTPGNAPAHAVGACRGLRPIHRPGRSAVPDFIGNPHPGSRGGRRGTPFESLMGVIDRLNRIPDFCTLFPAAHCRRPVPHRFVEACEPPPCPPTTCSEPPSPIPYADYLERQNLEDRVDWSPQAVAPTTFAATPDPARAPAQPCGKQDTVDRCRPEPRGARSARLADILPVPPEIRRVELETVYRLHLATGRPSGVLDVMG
jgi:hypothetical protein